MTFFSFSGDYTGSPVATMNEAVPRRSLMIPYSLLCIVVRNDDGDDNDDFSGSAWHLRLAQVTSSAGRQQRSHSSDDDDDGDEEDDDDDLSWSGLHLPLGRAA